MGMIIKIKRCKSGQLASSYIISFVYVVAEQFINEIDMGQEHPPAAVSGKSNLIQQFSIFRILGHVSCFVLEFLPLVGNHLPAAEATHWYDHLGSQPLFIITTLFELFIIALYCHAHLSNIFILSAMRVDRDSVDESVLDILDSFNRQLFFRYARASSEQQKQRLSIQIEKIQKSIAQLYPYEKYKILHKQQQQLRQILEKTQKKLEQQKQQIEKMKNQKTQFQGCVSQYLKLIQKIKKGFQTEHQVRTIVNEVKSIGSIKDKLNEEESYRMSHFDCLNYISQHIQKIQESQEVQLSELTQRKAKINEQIRSQNTIKSKVLQKIFLIQQQRRNIQLNWIQQAKQEQDEQSGGMSKLRKPQISSQIITNHKIIKSQKKIPMCYLIWALMLFIWFLLLLVAMIKPVPAVEKCY